MSMSHSEDVSSQLHQVFLMTGSCGVSSCTVGGNLSLTETDGDIDDWDICPPEVVVLCGNKKKEALAREAVSNTQRRNATLITSSRGRALLLKLNHDKSLHF